MTGALRLDQLDAHQRIAVETDGGPLRILAGPGSGKTRVLTHRIARRTEAGDIDPRRVLALTFTRRAAGELRTRLYRLGIRDVGAVGTFHSVALAQIRQHRADTARRTPTVLSSRRPLLAELIENDPHRYSGVHVATAVSEIDWACAQGLTADEYANAGRRRIGNRAAHVAHLLETYHEVKRRKGVFDFDDLLLECTHLLRTDQAFRNAQQWLFRHVFVDEFQDLNRPQFDLLTAWVGDRTDLCVVGDPDQAIYGWNGADASLLTELERVYPSLTTVELRANHRSAPAIVAAADAVLERESTPTERSGDGRPTVTEYESGEEEAAGIARHVRWNREPGSRWSTWAVLARTNDQLATLATALSAVDVPARVRGRGGMLQLPEVVEVIDRLCAPDVNFRITAHDLEAELLDDGPATPAGRMVELALEFLAEEPSATGDGFRSWLRTIRPGDLEGTHDAVDLVTFHAAKGLEWPNVIIAGTEAGFVPVRDNDPEERRLFYVAVSRAEHRLHLTWARNRTRNGVSEPREPSPWLELVQAAATEPAPVDTARVSDHLAAARSATAADDAHITEVRRALSEWRARTARARRVAPAGLLRDSDLDAIAEAQPTDLAELAAATGHSEHRLSRLAPAILEVITSAAASTGVAAR